MKIGQVVRFGYDSKDNRHLPTVRQVQIVEIVRVPHTNKIQRILGWDLTKGDFRSFLKSKMFGVKTCTMQPWVEA